MASLLRLMIFTRNCLIGRKYIGIELKPEYYEVAKINLKTAEELSTKKDLFTFSQEESGVTNGN